MSIENVISYCHCAIVSFKCSTLHNAVTFNLIHGDAIDKNHPQKQTPAVPCYRMSCDIISFCTVLHVWHLMNLHQHHFWSC